MYEHFIAVMKPDREDTILDFGVSEEITSESNALERKYPFPQQITCTGLGDGSLLKAAFPAVQHVTLRKNTGLPFERLFECRIRAPGVRCRPTRRADRALARRLAGLSHCPESVVSDRTPHWDSAAPFSCRPLSCGLRYTGMRYWADPRNLDFISKRGVARFTPQGMPFPDGLLRASTWSLLLKPCGLVRVGLSPRPVMTSVAPLHSTRRPKSG
jgi:hypothetical protein